MNRAAAAALNIDVLVDSEQWKKSSAAKAVVRRAITQAAIALSTPPAELAVLLTDNGKMRTLNRHWRAVDAATNVLSFPTKSAGGRHLGDIAFAYETIVREARAAHKIFDHHLAHLAVHGFLHLLGYDHETDKQAREMEHLERVILGQLAIPDPYASIAPVARVRRPADRRAAKQRSRNRAQSAQTA
jgi:probable rRNA maturation factor